jgi:hypothetical protein
MSLLSIISDPAKGCAVRCGLTPPTSLFGSSDPNAPLLIALAQEEGEELSRRHDWQSSHRRMGGGRSHHHQQAALPAITIGFCPTPSCGTCTFSSMSGPMERRNALARIVRGDVVPLLPGANRDWRRLFIVPAPTAGRRSNTSIHLRKTLCARTPASQKTVFTADTDTPFMPERLIGLGIIWRWKKDKGFAYAEHMATYERALELACSRDRGPPRRSREQAAPLEQLSGISSTWPGTIIV